MDVRACSVMGSKLSMYYDAVLRQQQLQWKKQYTILILRVARHCFNDILLLALLCTYVRSCHCSSKRNKQDGPKLKIY